MGGKTIKDIVRSPKRITNDGQWASGTMPRSAFPLSKSGGRSYKLGNRRWRVIVFEADGVSCRLLINYHPMLLEYQAILGVELGGDTKVLACLEYHPTHKPWHIHVCCDAVKSIPSGIKRGPWLKSMNGTGAKHRLPAPVSDDCAFKRAVSFFGLDRRENGGLV